MELQERMAAIHEAGLGLAAISYDPVSVLADFSHRRGITFPLLSDEGSKVIRTYGILNTTVPETNRGTYGIPFPGTFVLDANAIVKSRVFEAAYQERDTIASVMLRLGRGLATPGRKVTASHVTLTTYTSDQAVSPGTHFSIVVAVEPADGVHVYAPGVSGYKPIALRIDSQPGLVLREVDFPPAEDYYFKPLDEHVRVYQKPFRLVQDVMIDPSREGAPALAGRDQVTMSGTLEYQACDEKVCFTPQSVPLSWTVQLRALDRDRARKR